PGYVAADLGVHRARPDRSRRGFESRVGLGRIEVSIRIGRELVEAARAAEMVGRTVQVMPVLGGAGIHLHAADRIGHDRAMRLVGAFMPRMVVTLGHVRSFAIGVVVSHLYGV